MIPPVKLDEKLQQRIVDQASASFGKTPIAQMERQRDNAQVALLRSLASQNEKDRS